MLRKNNKSGKGITQDGQESPFWEGNFWVKTQQKVRKSIPASAKPLRWANVLCVQRTAKKPMWLEDLVSKGKNSKRWVHRRVGEEVGPNHCRSVVHNNGLLWMRQEATEETQAQMWQSLTYSLKGSLCYIKTEGEQKWKQEEHFI